METKKLKRGIRRRKAATEEVIGDAASKPSIPPRWERHYQRLMDLRNHLLNRRADLVRDAQEEKPAASQHLADVATDQYDQDFAFSMVSSEQNALNEIEQALSRIGTGSYGVCELTGKPIKPERLKAIPWTRFCAEAEQELEKNRAVDRTHLGPRENIPRSDTFKQIAEEVE